MRARPTELHRSDGSTAEASDLYGNPLLARLDPADGQRLRALPGELVWASTWTTDANEIVAPLIGLPTLPVVDWPDTAEQQPRGVHWKTAPLLRWAAGRPFVWLADEITDADRHWATAHHPQPALLHRVDSYEGLSAADLTVVRQWLDHHDEAD